MISSWLKPIQAKLAGRWVYLGGWLLVILLSFTYLYFTRWPIGDDPAVHIFNIKTTSYENIWRGTVYPIPILLLKWVHEHLHLSGALAFSVLITSFLAVAGCLIILFCKKIFKSELIGIGAALFFVTNFWVNNSLSMGVFSEVFSWIPLILSVYYILQKNWFLAALFTVMLLFSHPIALSNFILGVAVFIPLSLLIKEEVKEKKRTVWFTLLYILILGGFFYFLNQAWPDRIETFTKFINPEKPWGDRTLWTIFTNGAQSSVKLGVISAIGFGIALYQTWRQRVALFGVIYMLVATLMILNYRFGLSFLTFRYYSYFFLGIAILAGYGLYILIQEAHIAKPKAFSWVYLGCVLFLTGSSYASMVLLLQRQTTQIEADAIMLPPDQRMILWIKDNVDNQAMIYAPYKYRIWIKAEGERYNLAINPEDPAVEYKYYPANVQVPEKDQTNFALIKSDSGVSLWKRN